MHGLKEVLPPYLYRTDPNELTQCNANPFLPETDLRGGDFLTIIPSSAHPNNCVTLCCAHMSCAAW